MDKSIIYGIIAGVIFLGMITIIGMNTSNIDHNTNVVLNDLNVLKTNDLAFAQYITANSQTLDYLNKNCKVTSDTNEVTVLTCLKIQGGN